MKILVGLRIQKFHFGLISLFKDIGDFLNINNKEFYNITILLADLHSIIGEEFYKKEFIDKLHIETENLIKFIPKTLSIYSKYNNYALNIETQYNLDILELSFLIQNIVSYSEIYSIPNIAERHRSNKFTPIAFYNYPILQYADIIYQVPDIVFMGKDQIPIMKLFNTVLNRLNKTKIFKAIDKLKPYNEISKPILIYSDKYIVDEYDKKIGSKVSITDSDNDIYAFFNKMMSNVRGINIPCNRSQCLFFNNIKKILQILNYETHYCSDCKKYYISKILKIKEKIVN